MSDEILPLTIKCVDYFYCTSTCGMRGRRNRQFDCAWNFVGGKLTIFGGHEGNFMEMGVLLKLLCFIEDERCRCVGFSSWKTFSQEYLIKSARGLTESNGLI